MEQGEHPEVLLSDRNGLLPVNVLIHRLKAVCFIQATVVDGNQRPRPRRGTGFFAQVAIANKNYYVIFTNNHVLSKEKDAENAEAIFGYDYKNQGKKISLRPSLIFRTNQDLDYTLVGVQKDDVDALNLKISPLLFIPEPKVCEGDEIFILQHPKGRPKEFSHDKIIKVEPPFIYYKADTESGSSGAPVFWQLNLVAIHQKGSEELGYNKGVLCSEIISHLNSGKYTIPKNMDLSDSSQEKEIDEERLPIKRQKISEDFSTQLTINELEELSRETITIWKHLGRKLGVDNNKIEEISRDHINYDGICEKAFQMLLFWKDSSKDPSIRSLGEALQNLGKCNLAKKYCKM